MSISTVSISSLQRSCSPTTSENIEIMEDDSLGFFFNFEKVNNFRHVNQVFIALNKKMKPGGVLVGCFESYDQRKQRIFGKFPGWFARIFYIIDFIYKRIMPKIPVLKQIYFQISRGKKRVFSRTEVLGRLYYCGFEVIGLRPINNIYYFIAKKTKSRGPIRVLPTARSSASAGWARAARSFTSTSCAPCTPSPSTCTSIFSRKTNWRIRARSRAISASPPGAASSARPGSTNCPCWSTG